MLAASFLFHKNIWLVCMFQVISERTLSFGSNFGYVFGQDLVISSRFSYLASLLVSCISWYSHHPSMHLSELEGSPIFTSFFAMSNLFETLVFGLTTCDFCLTSVDFLSHPCRTGFFEGLGGVGTMDLLRGTGGAWASRTKVMFLVLSNWISSSKWGSGLIVTLLVNSTWISVSLLDERSSSTSDLTSISGTSSLFFTVTMIYLSWATVSSSKVT